MLLTGKLAIVTGAAQGLGQAVAEGFAKEGATVILVDLSPKVHQTTATLNTQFPRTPAHSSFICDVSSGEQVDEMFERIKLLYEGRTPTLIVNNAGIFIDKTLLDSSEFDFERTVNVNLKSAFLVTQAAMRHLVPNFSKVKLGKTESYASVINMASVAGRRAFLGNSVHYSASKAGMEAMVRQSAHELGKYKIRCNAVCPGPIATPLQTDAERLVKHISYTKLGRVGEPHEVADLCVFLASDKSSFITGASIDINGGFLV
jgi:17beta-estradiol 17-dehydrogenase/3alpha(17beta)-hydroxysteroid dehydrogenase (NAD+)